MSGRLARVIPFSPSQPTRRLLLLAASMALAWAAVVAVTGGVRLRTPWGQVSSHTATRPFLLGAIGAAAYLLAYRRHLEADLAPLQPLCRPRAILLVAIVGALVVGIHWSSFLAAGPDASGYVSQADLWWRGDLMLPAPDWVAHADWPDAGRAAAPVGYRPGAHGDFAPTYPPGLPLLMAALRMLGGADAMFLVVPLFGAVAVWASYRLGVRLGGASAGAMASALLATSPAFLIMLVQPMSDVPAAACWALALVAALRGDARGAAVAGVVTALAILIRPNLVPLAGIVAAAVAIEAPALSVRAWRVLLFGACATPAFVLLAAINARLFGSPFESGYGSIANLYAARDILPNLRLYGEALFTTQTPAILVGLALPFVIRRDDPRWSRSLLVAIAFPATVVALYLPYERVKVWWFLRFLLPAYPALLATSAAAIVISVSRLRRRPAAAWLPAVVTVLLAAHGIVRAAEAGVFGIRDADQRYAAASEFARKLPEGSVLLSEVHNGTLHYYSARDVLRWKIVAPEHIDRALSALRRDGRSAYLVVDESELDAFRDRFRGARVLQDLNPELAARIGDEVLVYPLAGSRLP